VSGYGESGLIQFAAHLPLHVSSNELCLVEQLVRLFPSQFEIEPNNALFSFNL
jgi:hypothetical protein